jgi:hypothetical protein
MMLPVSTFACTTPFPAQFGAEYGIVPRRRGDVVQRAVRLVVNQVRFLFLKGADAGEDVL